jgi:hypothetical protein
MESSQGKPNLYAALALAQRATADIKKNAKADIGKYSYSYADLASILEVVRPACNEQGLFFSQEVESVTTNDEMPQQMEVDGEITTIKKIVTVVRLIRVRIIMYHSSGESLITPWFEMKPTETTPQAVGTAITYAKRYQLAAFFGVATEDDDALSHNAPNDAPKSTPKPQPKQQAPKPPKPTEAPTQPVQQPKTQAAQPEPTNPAKEAMYKNIRDRWSALGMDSDDWKTFRRYFASVVTGKEGKFLDEDFLKVVAALDSFRSWNNHSNLSTEEFEDFTDWMESNNVAFTPTKSGFEALLEQHNNPNDDDAPFAGKRD